MIFYCDLFVEEDKPTMYYTEFPDFPNKDTRGDLMSSGETIAIVLSKAQAALTSYLRTDRNMESRGFYNMARAGTGRRPIEVDNELVDAFIRRGNTELKQKKARLIREKRDTDIRERRNKEVNLVIERALGLFPKKGG